MKDWLEFISLFVVTYFSSLVIIFLSTFGHELGHVLFGKLTGYRFVSFSIGKFLLYKKKDKFYFVKRKKSGLAGQALMGPPDFSSSFPYIFYNIGGVIINLLFALVGIIAVIKSVEALFTLLFFTAIVVINLFLLNNGLPIIVSGVPTDGKNIQYASQNQAARYALFVMLKSNELLQSETDIESFPDEWFNLKEGADHANPLVIYQDWLILEKLTSQILKGKTSVPVLETINDRLPFLKDAPLYYKMQFSNESIFWFLLCDYQTDWAMSVYESEEFKKMDNVHKLPNFYKTHAIIALKKNDLTTARKYIQEGLASCKGYPGMSNEKLLLNNLEESYREWKDCCTIR